MEQQEKTKNPVGRPKSSTMKSYHYKAEGDLIPLLDKVENRNGFINPRCDDCKGCDLFKAANKNARTIRALWCKGNAAWSYETDIPHETFGIFDDELYCNGIVFSVDDV